MVVLRDSMARFAQPIRVGDLAHRYLLAPAEQQNVLGRVAEEPVVRTPTGNLFLVVNRGGFLGFGTTRVAVPMEEVAVVGEHVALIGLSRPNFAALPSFVPADFVTVAPDTMIKIAIVGPFH